VSAVKVRHRPLTTDNEIRTLCPLNRHTETDPLVLQTKEDYRRCFIDQSDADIERIMRLPKPAFLSHVESTLYYPGIFHLCVERTTSAVDGSVTPRPGTVGSSVQLISPACVCIFFTTTPTATSQVISHHLECDKHAHVATLDLMRNAVALFNRATWLNVELVDPVRQDDIDHIVRWLPRLDSLTFHRCPFDTDQTHRPIDLSVLPKLSSLGVVLDRGLAPSVLRAISTAKQIKTLKVASWVDGTEFDWRDTRLSFPKLERLLVDRCQTFKPDRFIDSPHLRELALFGTGGEGDLSHTHILSLCPL